METRTRVAVFVKVRETTIIEPIGIVSYAAGTNANKSRCFSPSPQVNAVDETLTQN